MSQRSSSSSSSFSSGITMHNSTFTGKHLPSLHGNNNTIRADVDVVHGNNNTIYGNVFTVYGNNNKIYGDIKEANHGNNTWCSGDVAMNFGNNLSTAQPAASPVLAREPKPSQQQQPPRTDAPAGDGRVVFNGVEYATRIEFPGHGRRLGSGVGPAAAPAAGNDSSSRAAQGPFSFGSGGANFYFDNDGTTTRIGEDRRSVTINLRDSSSRGENDLVERMR
jgi:hypothetical protein